MALAAAAGLAVAGCGGSHTQATVGTTGTLAGDGLSYVSTVSFRSPYDGSTVDGLLAQPHGLPSRGCVIWELGLDSDVETELPGTSLWAGLSELGLTGFSIDLRYNGSRASYPTEPLQVVKTADGVRRMILGTVGDIKGAVTYLEAQPYCRHNVNYFGISTGGVVGAIAAAQDTRIRAVGLIVTPGTFRAVLLTPGTGIVPAALHDRNVLDAALKILTPLDPASHVGKISPRPVLILNGRYDTTVTPADAHVLQAAARQPAEIFNYAGGHNPITGPDAAVIANKVESFLLRWVVEPSYEIKGNEDGTFTSH